MFLISIAESAQTVSYRSPHLGNAGLGRSSTAEPPPPARRPRDGRAPAPQGRACRTSRTCRHMRPRAGGGRPCPSSTADGERVVEVCSATAVRPRAGLPVVAIRWARCASPHRFGPQALLCLRSGPRPAADRPPIPPAPAGEGDIPGGARPPRRRDAAPAADRTIARTTPCLLGLCSLMIPLAARLDRRAHAAVSTDTWYGKSPPTVADTLAAVRRHYWGGQGLLTPGGGPRRRNSVPRNATASPRALPHRLIAEAVLSLYDEGLPLSGFPSITCARRLRHEVKGAPPCRRTSPRRDGDRWRGSGWQQFVYATR